MTTIGSVGRTSGLQQRGRILSWFSTSTDLDNLFLTNVTARDGDSGSPVYIHSGASMHESSVLYLIGIVFAGDTGFGHSCRILEVKYHLNLTIYCIDVHNSNFTIVNGEAIVNGRQMNDNVTSIIIPPTFRGYPVTRIAHGAFMNHPNLTHVLLPNSITHIGNRAFANTGISNITIPASVRNIDAGAFLNSSALRTVTFAPNSQLQTIDEAAFAGTNLSPAGRDQHIQIPNSVRSIGLHAFTNTPLYNDSTTAVIRAGNWVVGLRTNSTSSLHHIPSGTVGIANGALANHGTRLQQVTLPNTLRYIGVNAFMNSRLRSIEIPRSVLEIRDSAFLGARELDRIYIRRTVADGGITQLGNQAFSADRHNWYILVPECSYFRYRGDSSWGHFGNRISIEPIIPRGPIIVRADGDPQYINARININYMRTLELPVYFVNAVGAGEKQVVVEFARNSEAILQVFNSSRVSFGWIDARWGNENMSFTVTANARYIFQFSILGAADIRLRVRAERMPSEPQLLGHGSGTSIHFDINYDDLIGYAVRVLHDLTVPAHQTNAHIWLYYTNFSQSNFSIVATPTRSLRFSWNSTKQD